MVSRFIPKALFPILLLALAALASGLPSACSSESSSLGQYRQGRTLHFSVVTIERIPELRYSTIDPEGIVRRWSISPSRDDMELVLMRAKVENHTAVSAFINVDRTAADLRDFGNSTFRPLTIPEVAWQDFRGEPEALVRMDLGQCFDGTRALIDTGSAVRWQNEAEDSQFLAFDDAGVGVGAGGRAEIATGDSLTRAFDQPGTYPYRCGNPEVVAWPAELQVANPVADAKYVERSILFLQGSFELVQGNGVDGYMLFEAPIGTEFRDVRWRAGDSIIFRF